MLRATVIGLAMILVGALALIAQAAFEQPKQRKAPPQAVERDLPFHSFDTGVAVENKLLHDQVSLCNLVNALWLEEPQIKQMIAILEPEMGEIINLRNEVYGNGSSPEFGDAMAELLATLKNGEEADENLKKRVNSYSGPTNKTRLNYQQARRDVAEKLMPILSDNQLILLGEYKPCLFSANDPLHPERVGQASSASRIVEMLTRIRNAPDRVPKERFEKGLTRMAEHARKDTPFEIDIEAEKARLKGLVDKALALNDEEFSLQVEDIAKEMACYQDAKDQMRTDKYNLPTGKRDHRIDKLANMLVIPGVVEILAAELQTRSE